MDKLQHVTHSQQFDTRRLDSLFSCADQLRAEHAKPLEEKMMACLFYEPSTRTRFSFESAMKRLGGDVLVTDNAGMFSSAAKGETLEDTIRVIAGYADIIVLRHPQQGAAIRAAKVSPVPVINAGDGGGQHPTQALLDLYTIHHHRKTIDGLSIAMVGDLKYGRTVRSLTYLLGKYDDVKISFVSPPHLRMREDILSYCDENKVRYHFSSLAKALEQVDCVYMTRNQAERSENKDMDLQEEFILTAGLADTMKEDAIIMHPLPRLKEIPIEVDANPRAKYFEQAKNGLYIRMALLTELLADTQDYKC